MNVKKHLALMTALFTAGAYAVAARQWLNWQLKGKVGDSALFMNDEYGKMIHPDWTFDRKNW